MPSDPFYQSEPWRQMRRTVLRERPVCQIVGCGKRAGHVDHIVARRAGGAPLDRMNLQALCHGCHSRKTVGADGGFGNRPGGKVARLPGCDASGRPPHWQASPIADPPVRDPSRWRL